MLAKSKNTSFSHYTSDRVYSGTRTISAGKLSKIKAGQKSTLENRRVSDLRSFSATVGASICVTLNKIFRPNK